MRIESLGFQRRRSRYSPGNWLPAANLPLMPSISTSTSIYYTQIARHSKTFLKKFHFPCSQNGTFWNVYSRGIKSLMRWRTLLPISQLLATGRFYEEEPAIGVGLMFLRKAAGNWYLAARSTAAAAAIDPATSHQPPATSYRGTIRICHNVCSTHTTTEGPGLFDSSCFCLFDD